MHCSLGGAGGGGLMPGVFILLKAPDIIYEYYSIAVQVTDSCECGNELSGSVKCGEFLD